MERINRIIREGRLWRTLDEKFGFGLLERFMSRSWINPFATLYINLRTLPFCQAIKLPVVVYGNPKFYSLVGNIVFDCKVRYKLVRFNKSQPGAPSNMNIDSELLLNGTIVFKGEGLIGKANKIVVSNGKTLILGDKFKITDCCNIGVYAGVSIGEMTRVTHRCQILDSNYHYIANLKKRTINNHASPIIIGDGCWVCNSSTVAGGSKIPNYTIVGSNSLVNKDFTDIGTNCLIGGVPAKKITDGIRRLENIGIESDVTNWFRNKNNKESFIIDEDVTPDQISFAEKFRIE